MKNHKFPSLYFIAAILALSVNVAHAQSDDSTGLDRLTGTSQRATNFVGANTAAGASAIASGTPCGRAEIVTQCAYGCNGTPSDDTNSGPSRTLYVTYLSGVVSCQGAPVMTLSGNPYGPNLHPIALEGYPWFSPSNVYYFNPGDGGTVGDYNERIRYGYTPSFACPTGYTGYWTYGNSMASCFKN